MQTATTESLLPMNRPRPETTDRIRLFKVQRTCINDGPGVRTTLFFQGCGLRCRWCQNPEGLEADLRAGRLTPIEDLAGIVGRDRAYYRATGGGVTLSGGEPLLQDPKALVLLVRALKAMDIPVAVETALHAPSSTVALVAPLVDLFLVDLKVVGDDELHRRLTGQGDALIGTNLRHLWKMQAKIRFRMTIVPGLNDSEGSLCAAAALLRSMGHPMIELLKYHDMYVEKARRLGIPQESPRIPPDRAEEGVRAAIGCFAAQGITAHCLELDPPRRQAEFTPRVRAVRDDIWNSEYHVCMEASRLKTRYYKRNGFDKPTPIHRADRLAYVLRHKEIIVYPHELLVGNFTAKRRGGQVWEEHFGAILVAILHRYHRQKPVSYKTTPEDRRDFYTEIFPFWARHGLVAKMYPRPSEMMRAFARCAEMKVGFNNNLAAIAHFVVNFRRVLELGTTGLIVEIREKMAQKTDRERDFYLGCIIALEGLEAFGQRYEDRLAKLAESEPDPTRRKELEDMAAICARVPRLPARTFHEALQSMLFLQVALCIESYENAVSFGRLDQVLHPYYARDRDAGILTYDQAKELLALFILKMDEIILLSDGEGFMRISRLFETQSVDQTVTAGGMDRLGRDATNEVTYMLLDICELQPLAVNMAARIHAGSPPEYLERLAEVYLTGTPMPALYNDHIYVATLLGHYDTTVEDARDYAIIGCVEPNASDDHFGNTDCANLNVVLPFLQALKGEDDDLWRYGPLGQIDRIQSQVVDFYIRGDRLPRFMSPLSQLARRMPSRSRLARLPLLRATGKYRPPASMDDLLARFQARLNELAAAVLADHQEIERHLRAHLTTPLASSLYRGCIESGRDVYEGGTRFNSSGIQAIGITDVADSLHAIDEVVFWKRLFTIPEILRAMDENFEGPENQRIHAALLAVPKFGDDSSETPQQWMNRTLRVYVDALRSVPNCPRGGFYSAGYYALNANIVYGRKTPSLPSGRLAGTPLANSLTPHYGMRQNDLLSALNAIVGLDFCSYAPNGTTVTFTVDASLFQGADGIRNLAGIVKGYFDQGGMQFQPNVIRRDLLLDAYHHPEKYPYLLVRVAGYCAYFNDLSDDLKKVIIQRTCYC